MNRRQYQKKKNRFDYLNKKLYRLCQGKLAKMPIDSEDRKYWIEKAKEMNDFYVKHQFNSERPFAGKYKPHIVMAEESKWIIHQNWAYMPSWCTYKKNHPTEAAFEKAITAIAKALVSKGV